MGRLNRCVVAALMLMAAAMPARAAERLLDLVDPPVSYTASFTVSSDKGTYSGTVWHAPGRERRDFATRDGGQAVVLRRDTDSAFLMKPSGRWYVGLGLGAVGALAGGIDGLTVERTRQGSETVAGIRATKFRVSGSGPRGSRFDGHAWFSPQGILLRAEGDLTAPGGQTSPVETRLDNVRLGAVDDSLFEMPKGWMALDLRSVPPERLVQAMESLRPLLSGR